MNASARLSPLRARRGVRTDATRRVEAAFAAVAMDVLDVPVDPLSADQGTAPVLALGLVALRRLATLPCRATPRPERGRRRRLEPRASWPTRRAPIVAQATPTKSTIISTTRKTGSSSIAGGGGVCVVWCGKAYDGGGAPRRRMRSGESLSLGGGAGTRGIKGGVYGGTATC